MERDLCLCVTLHFPHKSNGTKRFKVGGGSAHDNAREQVNQESWTMVPESCVDSMSTNLTHLQQLPTAQFLLRARGIHLLYEGRIVGMEGGTLGQK